MKKVLQVGALMSLGALAGLGGELSAQARGQAAHGAHALVSGDSRVTVTTIRMNEAYAAFVKDTRTNGCWLYVANADGNALAPAPPEACAFK